MAGRPLDKAHSYSLFDGCERSGYRRSRTVQPSSGGPETAGIQYRHEDFQFVEPIHDALFQKLELSIP